VVEARPRPLEYRRRVGAPQQRLGGQLRRGLPPPPVAEQGVDPVAGGGVRRADALEALDPGQVLHARHSSESSGSRSATGSLGPMNDETDQPGTPDWAHSFGSVAEAYERGRPTYPADAVQWLLGDQTRR